MIKRRLKKAAAVLVLAVFTLMTMCSCMIVETGFIFNEDGKTVTVYEETAFEKSTLDEVGMTADDYFEWLNENGESSFEGWDYEDSEFEKDGKTYINRRYYKICTYEEASDVNEFEGRMVYEADYNIQEEGSEITVTVKYKYKGEAAAEDEEFSSEESEDNEDISYNFCIEAPFEVIETNGTVESEYKKTDKNSVSVINWDYTDIITGTQNELTFNVTFKKGGFPLLALIIVGVVMTIAIAAIVLVVVSKKKKPQLPVTEYVPPVETNSFAQTQPAAPVQPEAPAESTPAPEAPAEVPAEAPAAEEEEYNYDEVKTYCRNCGNQVGETDAFCQNCGEPVNK